ncbi:hypothetical protein PRZ48_006899 [Zasmidium cellare]|uniref:Uncharacterized protein n=1 Tax=Zasmidium cellare TaxID=395010 RepID=A0ABR0EIS1_ZASCE|nr:hypothetical protein PRZ48_006899 [Zasmidium cellare]
MPRTTLSIGLVALSILNKATAVPNFSFCTNEPCTNCPVSVSSEGTGYPECVIYNSENVFGNQGFSGSEGGGTEAYLDIPDPGEGCYIIVKSPADTTMEGCGVPIGVYGHATCSALDLKSNFMVQFCCGSGDCTAAGATKRSAKFRTSDLTTAGGIISLKLGGPNGTDIEPVQTGLPPELRVESESGKRDSLITRDAACTAGSWVPDSGMVEYTEPASNTEIVSQDVTGGSSVQITTTRSESFSQTLMAGLSFADIVMIGVSFTLEESESESKAYTFNVPDGESGDVGWTAYLMCSTGKSPLAEISALGSAMATLCMARFARLTDSATEKWPENIV